MRQAALDAGILEPRLCSDTTLHFVSEPEAAALATLRDMKAAQFGVCLSFTNNHKNMLTRVQKGDCIVVCDAGGGTVVSNIHNSLELDDQPTNPS